MSSSKNGLEIKSLEIARISVAFLAKIRVLGGVTTMKDVLDKIENRGIEKGANDIWSLVQKLFAKGRGADAERASKDEEFRAKLMKEFGMAVVK